MKRRADLPTTQAEMAMMYANTAPTYQWQPGTRDSGFFSSMGRHGGSNWATVRDHWVGIAETLKGERERISPEEFVRLAGDRDIPIPTGEIVRNVAERQIARYDREQREAEYERNWRSAVGGFIGAVPPWIVSPEGAVGLAVPPVRVGTIFRAGAQGVRSLGQGTAGSRAASRALAEVPAGIAMGGTNLIAQQAAYGEIDALEATVAFAAPSALGGAIGAYQGAKASRRRYAMGEGKTMPPGARPDDPIDAEVPDRLIGDVRRTFGLAEGDTTPQVFAKIRDTLQTNNISPDIIDNLVESFARLAERRGIRLSPEAKDALARVQEIDALPVRQRSPVDTNRAAAAAGDLENINAEISRVTERLREVAATPASKQTDDLRNLLLEELSSLRAQQRQVFSIKRGAQQPANKAAKVAQAGLDEQANAVNPRVKRAKRTAKKAQADEARLQEKIKALEEAGDTAGVQRQTKRLNAARTNRENADADLAAIEKDVQTLRTARQSEMPDIAARQALRKQALTELADIMARETDAPLPAEFMAELLDNVAASRPVDPDVISGTPRFGVADDETAYAGARSMTEEDMLQRDPAFAALRKFEGADRASQVYARQEQILRDCPL